MRTQPDMAIQTYFFISLLLLLGSAIASASAATNSTYDDINRASFPKGFIFGAASSAYQVITY